MTIEYRERLPVRVTCPKCGKVNDTSVDLLIDRHRGNEFSFVSTRLKEICFECERRGWDNTVKRQRAKMLDRAMRMVRG